MILRPKPSASGPAMRQCGFRRACSLISGGKQCLKVMARPARSGPVEVRTAEVLGAHADDVGADAQVRQPDLGAAVRSSIDTGVERDRFVNNGGAIGALATIHYPRLRGPSTLELKVSRAIMLGR